MVTHSSTLAWKIPWTEEPGRLQSMGSRRVRHTEQLHFHFSLLCIGEGNGNPLQCSCLETPRDGGAWWAAVYGVAQSRTWLKRLSSSSSGQEYLRRNGIAIIVNKRVQNAVKVKSLGCVWLFAIPWVVAYQAPQSMGFSRQEYWSELPFPSPKCSTWMQSQK